MSKQTETKTICDFCGEEIKAKDWFDNNKFHSLFFGGKHYNDICQDCYNKLKDFLNELKD